VNQLQTKRNIEIKIKYLMDRIFAAILLILLSPLMLLIYIGVRVTSKGPGIFTQVRVGMGNKDFKIYKFRTMRTGSESGSFTLEGKDDDRITTFGKFLRKLSLDELPQLINILKGDMSFIGPRPTLRYQVDKYNNTQMRRLEMKPGLTGWAQVNGRNSIPWSKRIEHDVWYIDNYSLLLDIKILIKTIGVLFKQDIIYGESDDISKCN